MNEQATTRQTWALFCATKVDVRNLKLEKEQASLLIAAAKVNPAQVASQLIEMGGTSKGTPPKAKEDFSKIWDEAHAAGMAAVAKLQVVPMVVNQHANPMDDNSPVTRSYFVEDGVCGFAWVHVRGANSSFGRWLKEKELARRDSYNGGLSIWVHDFNQSLQKKEAYAGAFAEVLRKHDIAAYSGSRMD